MGVAIDRFEFEPHEYQAFNRRLYEGLDVLARLLLRRGFGIGPTTVGAELEMFLVDAGGRPAARNDEVLAHARDDRLTHELARFNIECNAAPVELSGMPFSLLQRQLESVLGRLRASTAHFETIPAVIGTLPTLGPDDFEQPLSGNARYRALADGLRRCRQGPVQIAIAGHEVLQLAWPDISLEGANTSLQLHLRVEPESFARVYNAAQLATPIVLAASGNSPFVLGRRLWDESRIPLFEQSSDDRPRWAREARTPMRVSFGSGWVRSGALELFEESVRLHAPIMPVLGPEAPLEALAGGLIPRLDELRLHHGTTWRWNRAVFDPSGGGHLRIELRALPAGPTLPDMLANAAVLLGLTLRLSMDVERILPAMPFEQARQNFYRAAREGLDAPLFWPAAGAPTPRRLPATELALMMLPLAREGLIDAQVAPEEADRLLAIFAARIERGITGARWQTACVRRLEAHLPREEALRAMLLRYLELAETGEPIHRWDAH